MVNVLEPNFKEVRISKHQDTKDIIKGIAKAVNESKEESKILAVKFYDKDKIKSCEKVWHYLKKKFSYIAEDSDNQTSKSLARYEYDKYGDCKHYTIYSYAILQALNIPVFMRLVSQKILNKEPTHIYTVAVINGKEYVVDPVMNDFNQECKYNYKCDLTLNKNMMTHLSGTHDVSIGKRKRGGFFDKAKDKLTAKEKETKAKFLATQKKHNAFLKKQGKKVTTGVKKRYASIKKDVAVKSFLWAVSKNYLNLANRIKEVFKTHPEDLKKFWGNFGAWTDLTKAVNVGAGGTAIGYVTDKTCKCGNQNIYAKECCTSMKGLEDLPVLSGLGQDEEGGGQDQSKQYEEGAKASMSIIQMIIKFFQDRKAKKNAKQDQADADALKGMEASIMSDPNIAKVDENGNPITSQTATDNQTDEDLPFLQTTTGMVTLGLGTAGILYLATKK